jgi:hypothetical protein
MPRRPARDGLVIDDRGDERPLYNLGSFVRPESERGVLSDAEMRALRKRARGGWLWTFWLNLTPALGLGIFALFLFRGPSSRSTVELLGSGGLVLGLAVSLWYKARRGDEADMHAALLDAGRCPSCAYPIADRPLEPDGCRLCHECGAAWRIPVPPSGYGKNV